MIPVQFASSNCVLGASQDEYEPLPVYLGAARERPVTACFRLTDAEIEEIVRTRTLWYTQLTFGSAFHPVLLSTQKPDHL